VWRLAAAGQHQPTAVYDLLHLPSLQQLSAAWAPGFEESKDSFKACEL